jgi:hypothetical protein
METVRAIQVHAGSLLGSFFRSEDGGDMFLRIVGLISMDYTEIYPKEIEIFVQDFCCKLLGKRLDRITRGVLCITSNKT